MSLLKFSICKMIPIIPFFLWSCPQLSDLLLSLFFMWKCRVCPAGREQNRVCIQKCITGVVTVISCWYGSELQISKSLFASSPPGRRKGATAYQEFRIFDREKITKTYKEKCKTTYIIHQSCQGWGPSHLKKLSCACSASQAANRRK